MNIFLPSRLLLFVLFFYSPEGYSQSFKYKLEPELDLYYESLDSISIYDENYVQITNLPNNGNWYAVNFENDTLIRRRFEGGISKGVISTYYENGQLSSTFIIDRNRLISKLQFYSTGERMRYCFENQSDTNKLECHWYDDNGNIIKQINYIRGYEITELLFNDDGKWYQKLVFRNGVFHSSKKRKRFNKD